MAITQTFLKHWIWRAVKFFGALFLLLHLYAVALKFMPVPTTVLMMQRSGQGMDVRREWVSLDDVSPNVVYAVIGAEDARFCSHRGLDLKAIDKALEERRETGRRRGASTITQQTAKNVFFWNGGGWFRKAGEAWIASFIDFVWGKRRVLEVYLNVAEWGDGLFGAQAAARERFGVSAKDITQEQAALLAAVLPSPHKWRLDPPGPYVQERAEMLSGRIGEVKALQTASCVID